jgi:ABC-type dipeptide/oligopeptide/nickel transport system ATPase component
VRPSLKENRADTSVRPYETDDFINTETQMPEPILQVQQLKTYFYLMEGIVPAVEEVSFDLYRGETLGLVGESGSGKSVTALSILRLVPDPPGKIVGGKILFEGRDLLALPEKEMRKIRGNRISMIFQEPMTSLNPVLTIGEQIAEGIVLHEGVSKKEGMNQAVEMLRKVEIPAPDRRVREYPHQLSGGMRQRVMIAMALALRPAILIADEPTTALDVTIQRQILDLIRKLQEEIGMAVLLITHNLGIIAETAQRVVVMKEGRVVETSDVFSLFEKPQHPYTQQLLAAVPRLGETKKWSKKKKEIVLM